ncbi:histone-like nucleoid-structuring protein, MvaT/MvaU family [Pseudomonas asiatica]|uniref:histone-like nucleoid-structuring protein, MvaT/MvaU family n=1 Tax=Pseudomonas asiatica TaxID=2219225 RepID=UPI0010BFAE1B|nr:histone-like nucleoid-structuring protein, MvaT/MvaU family [Pseudomonas asiatica]EKT4529630.1 DNA binding protein [Pseudomonas putida]
MSLINEYRSTEESIRELEARLASLKDDPKLKSELEFEKKLKDLLGTYSKSLKDVISLLDPASVSHKFQKTGSKGVRKPREVKIYKHPESGEIVETKGGNQRTLKQWKDQYGADTVEGWRQQ